MKSYDYVVVNPQGQTVLQATAECRYPKKVEQDLLDNGYQIRLEGKRITKKDLRCSN